MKRHIDLLINESESKFIMSIEQHYSDDFDVTPEEVKDIVDIICNLFHFYYLNKDITASLDTLNLELSPIHPSGTSLEVIHSSWCGLEIKSSSKEMLEMIKPVLKEYLETHKKPYLSILKRIIRWFKKI